ncbi:hypothetical protein BGW80DRAFT_838945 [Lactifluus volemus]|nr:hypothetical protein BGW80DRAFT_838945 [Lactifluus volemus]
MKGADCAVCFTPKLFLQVIDCRARFSITSPFADLDSFFFKPAVEILVVTCSSLPLSQSCSTSCSFSRHWVVSPLGQQRDLYQLNSSGGTATCHRDAKLSPGSPSSLVRTKPLRRSTESPAASSHLPTMRYLSSSSSDYYWGIWAKRRFHG